ncbi:hypothetical protein R1sor_011746 [Riccia sorocarpa]|uniref:Uncharacterized protein n=1 Tax=Riccia sorocarpa TaxID=122646 RepID=A0ABD3I5M5_9MARC
MFSRGAVEGAKEYNIDISVEGLRRLVDFPAAGDCAKIVKPSVIEKAFFDHCGQKHKKEAWKVIAPWFSFNVNNARPRSEGWVVDDFRKFTLENHPHGSVLDMKVRLRYTRLDWLDREIDLEDAVRLGIYYAQPPFPGSVELDAGPDDQGPDETQNSPARSDADNIPESEEELVPIPENGLPGWIAVGVQYNPSDLRKYFLCDGKTWDSDWSTVNASKAINRYSMIEKEKARKELWRMQVKFDGELCEPVDPDSKKRRRTPSKSTPNKRPRETSGNSELPVGAEDEPTNLSSGEAPSNQQPTPDKGKAVVEDEPTRLDPNLAAKMEKARVKEATRRSLEQDPLTVPRFAVNDHGESSGQRSKGNLDSSCPPRCRAATRSRRVKLSRLKAL